MIEFFAKSSSLLMRYNPSSCCVHATLLYSEKGLGMIGRQAFDEFSAPNRSSEIIGRTGKITGVVGYTSGFPWRTAVIVSPEIIAEWTAGKMC